MRAVAAHLNGIDLPAQRKIAGNIYLGLSAVEQDQGFLRESAPASILSAADEALLASAAVMPDPGCAPLREAALR